ncbi:MAG: tetratricopeptide repeat protein [Thermodesulfovibrionales bacterium]|nr:tetratricopeptide repeat protein [Thermodesulfovibrionales bacterium]
MSDFKDAERQYMTEIYERVLSNPQDEETIKALEDFITQYPQFHPAINNLAVIYQEKGDDEKALTLYERAVELDGNNINYLKNLADFYLVQYGRLEDALRLYVRILEIDNENIEVYLTLGNICAYIKRYDDAQFFYDKVLEIEPWNITAMDNIDLIEEIKNKP